VDAPGYQGQTLEIVPFQSIALGKAEVDELDRDAWRRAGTDKGWIRCHSLTVAPHELGYLVRYSAMMIGAAFVASALVYLVARFVVLEF
jgi:hypothetical protein